MGESNESDLLDIDRAWIIECFRCSTEASSFEQEMHEARDEFAEAGWVADTDGYQMCPRCMGSGR